MRVFGLWRSKTKAQAASVIPPGLRAYAIGDVHGRLDLLRALLALVAADDAARGPSQTHVILLGDLIDRGPDSAAVIDYLLDERPDFATFHFIIGNHEEALLDCAGTAGGTDRDGWLSFGGRETLLSYGVSPATLSMGGGMLDAEIRARVPERHLAFLGGFNESIRMGDYLFVHAGIRPGIGIDSQSGHDMRWIREEFLRDPSDHGVIVVHGHTICDAPEFRANRIGIDTGAYRSGVLTALGLEGAERWIVATPPDAC